MSEIINGANMNKSGVYPGWKAGSAGGAGGVQSVEVTPIVEEGTKIASIAVDDVSTDLYAPAVEAGSATGLRKPDPIATTLSVVYDESQSKYVADKTFAELADIIDEYASDYDYVYIEVSGDLPGMYCAFHHDDGESIWIVLRQMGLTALNMAVPVLEDYQLTGYLATPSSIGIDPDDTISMMGDEIFIPNVS